MSCQCSSTMNPIKLVNSEVRPISSINVNEVFTEINVCSILASESPLISRKKLHSACNTNQSNTNDQLQLTLQNLQIRVIFRTNSRSTMTFRVQTSKDYNQHKDCYQFISPFFHIREVQARQIDMEIRRKVREVQN